MIRIPHLLASAMLLGCTPQAERGDPSPAPAEAGAEVTIGTIAVVGSAPVNVQVVVRTPEGQNYRLTGPLAEEVRRLSGAEVAVHGAITSSPDPMTGGQIQVTDYEIVSVDGEPAVMGEIVAIDGDRVRLRTRDGEDVWLTGAPDEFRVGQKVWVQGPTSVAIQAYGTLRP